MNLLELSDDLYLKHGDYQALFFEGRWYSSFELRDMHLRIAGALQKLGVEPNDRVAVKPHAGPVLHAIHYLLGTQTREQLENSARELFDIVGKGKVKIEVQQRFALKDAAEAHRALQGRKTTGSTILTI